MNGSTEWKFYDLKNERNYFLKKNNLLRSQVKNFHSYHAEQKIVNKSLVKCRPTKINNNPEIEKSEFWINTSNVFRLLLSADM